MVDLHGGGGETSAGSPTTSAMATAGATPPASRLKSALVGLALVALVASAAVGMDLFGLRERILGSATPPPKPVAVSRSADASTGPAVPSPTTLKPEQTVLRSQPWWQSLTDLKGTGPMTTTGFTVDPDATQWRVSWSCTGSRLAVQVPGRRLPLVQAGCPGNGINYATETGSKALTVSADGAWELVVEQQVDVPLVEPPLPAMTAPGAKAVATGTFYRIDQSGTGRVTVYRLATGAYALRLQDFFSTANVDLEIDFSPLPAPHSTSQYLTVPAAKVAPLDITAGSMNFDVPGNVDPTQYHSVVIWCPLITSAYSAATLTFTG